MNNNNDFISTPEELMRLIKECQTDNHPVCEEEMDFYELPESEQEAAKRIAEEQSNLMAGLSAEDIFAHNCREAYKLTLERGRINTCTIQRYLGTGYGMAARIIDELLTSGLIAPASAPAKGYIPTADGNRK